MVLRVSKGRVKSSLSKYIQKIIKDKEEVIYNNSAQTINDNQVENLEDSALEGFDL